MSRGVRIGRVTLPGDKLERLTKASRKFQDDINLLLCKSDSITIRVAWTGSDSYLLRPFTLHIVVTTIPGSQGQAKHFWLQR